MDPLRHRCLDQTLLELVDYPEKTLEADSDWNSFPIQAEREEEEAYSIGFPS